MEKKPVRLNLGSGDDYKEGYINCDWLSGMKADQYFDLQKFPYPFEENSCDEVLMDNVLNLLDDVVSTIKEIHRILKPGGVLKLYVPYAKSDWAFQSLYAQHFFTERSMQKFSDKWDPHYYPHTRFELIQNNFFVIRKPPSVKSAISYRSNVFFATISLIFMIVSILR